MRRNSVLLGLPLFVYAPLPTLAQEPQTRDAEVSAAVAVQATMDKLFPKIDKPAFRSADDNARVDAALQELVAGGLEIRFRAQVRDCVEFALSSWCPIARSYDPLQQRMIRQHTISYLDKLGLSGSEFGNRPLPADARQMYRDVDHWINWSRCYQPPSYPGNAISCELAFHPFSKPSPGVRVVFQTRGNRVLSMDFYLSAPWLVESVLTERERESEAP